MRGLGKANGVRIATLNIRLGRAEGLEEALQEPKQGNVDVGILQEIKLTDSIHARQGEGYSVWDMEEVIRYRGEGG